MDISPSENDKKKIPQYELIGLTFTTTYTLGLNLDFKLGKTKTANTGYKQQQSYGFLRFRYAYNKPQFPATFDGDFHSITIGFGGFGRAVLRDY